MGVFFLPHAKALRGGCSEMEMSGNKHSTYSESTISFHRRTILVYLLLFITSWLFYFSVQTTSHGVWIGFTFALAETLQASRTAVSVTTAVIKRLQYFISHCCFLL